MELYKYYSTQRPVDLGTFPKSINNPLLGFTNYDQRQAVEGGTMRAWGELIYLHPLTEKQLDNYELKPAPRQPGQGRAALYRRPTQSSSPTAPAKPGGRTQKARPQRQIGGFCMNDKNNPLQTVELSTEQNTNMIDGILNNAPP
ncbi:MAG: DUF4316 domain-containing protein, partial [Oscillospiraceae bacterium]